jgi:hypothetical protein
MKIQPELETQMSLRGSLRLCSPCSLSLLALSSRSVAAAMAAAVMNTTAATGAASCI